MWFNNLQVYRFTKPYQLDSQSLGQALETRGFAPCGSQDTARSGWVAPLGRHGSELVHASNGYQMLCLKRQDRLLPPAVVKEALEEKLIDIEEKEARKVSRKERLSLKDEIVFDLLPRAFLRSSLHYAYIAPRENLLVVNAASVKNAENLLHELRDCLGSLSVIPLTSSHEPVQVMTQWVRSGQPARGFTLGQECELRDNADKHGLIRCKNQDLSSSEIAGHLDSGMHVSKLALCWQDRIECLIDEKLSIKRLRFSDMVQERANEIQADDVATRFDVDFSIMSLELAEFIAALTEAFGGPASRD